MKLLEALILYSKLPESVKTLFLFLAAFAGLVATEPKPSAVNQRETLVWHAQKDSGITEATGRNDGPRVEAVIRTGGGSKGQPYCAYSIYTWGHESLGKQNPFPRSGWSPDFVRKPTWTRTKGGITPRPGDVGALYFPHLGRVGHVLLIVQWSSPRSRHVITMEGNTGPVGAIGEEDRNGDGFYITAAGLAPSSLCKAIYPTALHKSNLESRMSKF